MCFQLNQPNQPMIFIDNLTQETSVRTGNDKVKESSQVIILLIIFLLLWANIFRNNQHLFLLIVCTNAVIVYLPNSIKSSPSLRGSLSGCLPDTYPKSKSSRSESRCRDNQDKDTENCCNFPLTVYPCTHSTIQSVHLMSPPGTATKHPICL